MPLTDILSRATPPEDARATMEFEKMRFEISWRYFDFHARQRTQLFHFFIILTPFMFGGCFYLFKERLLVGYIPGQIASCAGMFLALVFFALDRRNRQMIDVGERALRLIEGQLLFTDFRSVDEDGSIFKGSLTTEKVESSRRCLIALRRHSFLVGAVYFIAFLAFGALLAYFVIVQAGYVTLPIKPITSP
ncbi:hypothetical protein ABIF38_001635 [Bradyrhizobium japonicum]|uniref:Uncharacterized protein n=1 Tax=Bradyrhizobium elkanii TaxID=29448 RepID=A0ABV4FHC3_BRAEL|nr:hypothetical protein [Bradyrhizobium elkanii]MBP2430610.1 hypothetical protein [Bradyrhizobium elkanii]MBR1162330.1 hypothetical protein [Bradyrhizobium elkanii]MCP1736050.1 hypothetical protein [Bradyrhizobium elkanii]MCP1753848.1 hypothetical protein [Bradyrhizobium elkanii]MCP1979368.1 hypothetical protein [Bradyrhizobium elkanii]